jgi:endonuclease/exonuclease/phosphatase family metal-dependent hydrolase
VAVDTPEGRLGVVNMHLGLAERERDWQIHHLLEHRLMQEFADLPFVVTGDY